MKEIEALTEYKWMVSDSESRLETVMILDLPHTDMIKEWKDLSEESRTTLVQEQVDYQEEFAGKHREGYNREDGHGDY